MQTARKEIEKKKNSGTPPQEPERVQPPSEPSYSYPPNQDVNPIPHTVQPPKRNPSKGQKNKKDIKVPKIKQSKAGIKVSIPSPSSPHPPSTNLPPLTNIQQLPAVGTIPLGRARGYVSQPDTLEMEPLLLARLPPQPVSQSVSKPPTPQPQPQLQPQQPVPDRKREREGGARLTSTLSH